MVIRSRMRYKCFFITSDMPPIVGYCPWEAPLRALSSDVASVITMFLLNHVM